MTAAGEKIKISVRGLSVAYGGVTVLKGLDLDIQAGEILSIIGPSNSGKTSFLRSLNRMNELNLHARTAGTVLLDGAGIVRDNITYGPRMAGIKDPKVLDVLVDESLRAVNLWDELKDGLKRSALSLFLEQKQRLCIARPVAVEAEVLLMDEPCSTLDPTSPAASAEK